eukprot:9811502-Ditylum_brightwellii.AAC.1
MNDENAMMTEYDYAEGLKAEFGMEVQPEAFGFNKIHILDSAKFDLICQGSSLTGNIKSCHV